MIVYKLKISQFETKNYTVKMIPSGSMMSLQEDVNNYFYIQTLKRKPKVNTTKYASTGNLSLIKNKKLTISQPIMVSAPQTAKKSNHIENKESILLTRTENELIVKLLGEKCQVIISIILYMFCSLACIQL